MIAIRQILRHSLLLVLATLVCSCEQDRLSDMPNVREGEAVEVRLDMKASEMMQVQTRAAADDEIVHVGSYTMVFDASMKLIEVAKVNDAAGGYTVKLASSSSWRKVVVVANAPETLGNLLPKLTTKDWTYNELPTEMLVRELPHTGTPGNADCRIMAMPTQHPMTGSIRLPAGINRATVINSTGVAGGDPLLLSRNTVKVTVAINTAAGADPSLANLTLQGANLAFAPLTASVLPESANLVVPTGHYVGNFGTLSDMMVGAEADGKSTEPLYCYSASNRLDMCNDGTCVVVKATYKGEPCYYRLDLRNANRAQIKLMGNHHYIVKISKAERKGYATPEEALSHVASNDLETIVVDPSANYIVSEGYSYLGLSAIEYTVPYGVQTNVVVSTVTHNAMGVTTSGVITVEGEGLSLANGADLPPSTDGSIQKKEIQVSVTPAFAWGRVTINLGGKLTQTIVLTTPPPIIIGGLEIARGNLPGEMDWATAMGRDASANETRVGTPDENGQYQVTMGDKPTGCNTLYVGAGNKWRVPTQDELINMCANNDIILDAIKVHGGKDLTHERYWSATELDDPTLPGFCRFVDFNELKPSRQFTNKGRPNINMKVRCVRDL